MGIAYALAEGIIIIEFILIIFIILLTYFVKFLIYLREKKIKKIKIKILHLINKLIHNQTKFKTSLFPRSWKKINLIIPIIEELDATHHSESWNDIRKDILHSIALPLARKYSTSYDWIKRYFSAKTFILESEKQDIKYIKELTKDTTPIIYINAIKAAVASESQIDFQEIIKQISLETWLSQIVYLEAFKNMSSEKYSMLKKELSKATDPLVRATFYKILLNYLPKKNNWDITQDINSTNKELRVSALKYISYIDKEAAIPALIEALKDSNWEIRLIAVHRLNNFKATQAINAIANCLHDSDWWVKMSAAEALRNMGEEGLKILKSEEPALYEMSFDIKAHIPGTYW